MKAFLRTAALAAAGLVASLGVHAQGEPIRIGAVLSATGPVGFIGDPQQKTLELQVKRLNEQGGVLGRKIALTVYDDQSDPNNANTFAKRLVDTDKVDVLLGGTTTPSAMAMVPSAERAGVPFV
jgi:branched-chain amino acid transport system substrate-binding protein